MSLIQNRGFRNTVLRSLVGLYKGLPNPDYVNMCQCLIFLEDPLSVAEVLSKLVQADEESQLMAYQIAFDLYESATQQFLEQVLTALRTTAPIPTILEEKFKPKIQTQKSLTVAATEEAIVVDDVKEEKSLENLVSEV